MSIKRRTKPLLPSLREKKRYLAFEILSEAKIKDYSSVSKQIKQNSLDFLGELGLAKAGIMLIDDCWDKDKQKGILRVNNKYVNHAKASLVLINHIGDKDVMVRSIGMSGSLKKAKQKYIAG
ncbi:Rpp14/Pop5 family protein [candidate division KSB1 bacterium]